VVLENGRERHKLRELVDVRTSRVSAWALAEQMAANVRRQSGTGTPLIEPAVLRRTVGPWGEPERAEHAVENAGDWRGRLERQMESGR
jgi:hypothetical protein